MGEESVITFILGGEASGKSAHALQKLESAPGPHLMLATGKAEDFAFRRQILDHREARDAGINVREVDLELPEALAEAKGRYGAVLVDSMDFWLFACAEADQAGDRGLALATQLTDMGSTDVLLVSCETGLGPVASTRAVREFVRAMGKLNQTLARIPDEVILVVAGRPMKLPDL